MPLRAYLVLFSHLTSFTRFRRLSTLESANSIPGVTTLYRKSLFQKIRDIKKTFSTQSVKPDSLVAPFRQMALDLYMHMNDAIAGFVIFMVSIFFLYSYSHFLHPLGEMRRIL